ncbi:hypothetical protein NECAME_05445 [Necator americanus]|uniref:Uncharacterized protein n=1 Tax=Necator americanus TaxID=51031 RepID=W2SGY6_NECAM|nr:hypothetical protein NECAME_05445 [Necator americanus]ETN68855.1 hypothetical protein NECAME_05445 [Necator americanus]
MFLYERDLNDCNRLAEYLRKKTSAVLVERLLYTNPVPFFNNPMGNAVYTDQLVCHDTIESCW